MALFRKKRRQDADPVPESDRAPSGAMDGETAQHEAAPPEADYYDWKARYRPWAGAEMMGPALAGAGVLALLVLILLAFVFHPIW